MRPRFLSQDGQSAVSNLSPASRFAPGRSTAGASDQLDCRRKPDGDSRRVASRRDRAARNSRLRLPMQISKYCLSSELYGLSAMQPVGENPCDSCKLSVGSLRAPLLMLTPNFGHQTGLYCPKGPPGYSYNPFTGGKRYAALDICSRAVWLVVLRGLRTGSGRRIFRGCGIGRTPARSCAFRSWGHCWTEPLPPSLKGLKPGRVFLGGLNALARPSGSQQYCKF